MPLNGKVALVTGGNEGIGKGIALSLASKGAKIGIIGRNEQLGRKAVSAIQRQMGKAVFLKCDVSKSKDVEDAVSGVVDKFGRLDILINNAGISPQSGSIAQVEEETWNRIIDVNLKGSFLFSKHAIPEIRHHRGGSITNIASVEGIFGAPNAVPYCASKGGMIALTKAMALDCAPMGIRVNCICPGAVRSTLAEQWWDKMGGVKRIMDLYSKTYPIGRIGEPKDIGELAAFLASDDASWITGSVIVIDGGLHAQYGEALIHKIAPP
jgi:NAD(P)-dependent dehydrogenase (short-subunit alcohol dehydrogenase family)